MILETPVADTNYPFLLREDHVRQVAKFLEGRFGINPFTGGNRLRIVVENQLAELQPKSFDAYIYYLRKEGSSALNQLLDSILIHETSFIRDPDQYASLTEFVIPDLHRRSQGKKMRFLSLGCSSGEEVYTLGIASRRVLGEKAGGRVEITGYDLSPDVLQIARRGNYDGFRLRDVNQDDKCQWFQEKGDHWEVKDELREGVQFFQQNLADPLLPCGVDLILCRNMLIYMSDDCRRTVFEAVHQSLLPHGYFLLGHSENALGHRDLFKSRKLGNALVYQPI
ncbi:MAG: protein-glutamate O-methyltransferase CheR [Verrucomicrobiota bacterium]